MRARSASHVGILPTELRVVATDPMGNRAERLVTRVWPLDYRQLPFVPIVVLVTVAAAALFLRRPRPVPATVTRTMMPLSRRSAARTRSMPLVRPLRGLGYALDRFGGTEIPARVRRDGEAPNPGRVADLTDLVSPPYDVINDSTATLLADTRATLCGSS